MASPKKRKYLQGNNLNESDEARKLSRLLEEITNSGENSLDQKKMKEIKKMCKSVKKS